jgi:hypothetical protein
MIGNKDIIIYYESFYKKKYGNNSYKFKPTPQAEKEIEKYLSFFDSRYKLISLGSDFLFRYFSFQFKRVDGLVLKRFSSKDKSGKIQIYDIIGRKAIEYWLTRDINFDFIIENSVIVSKKLIPTENTITATSRSEEIEKKRFFNTDRGILNCIEKTTLYNNKSSNCLLCNHKKSCKVILEKNHINIYKSRGYVTST